MAAMGGSGSFWMGSWQQCTQAAVLKGELIPLVSFFLYLLCIVYKVLSGLVLLLGCILMAVL